MEYIKSEKDEHRLRVIELGVRKMLERELMEIKAKLEKYKKNMRLASSVDTIWILRNLSLKSRAC